MSNSLLSDLGIEWDEGLTIPVANAENKYLEDDVQKKQRNIVAQQNELEENDDRVHAMASHLKNVRQELQHTQGLTNARTNEIESESHMKKLAEREQGRLAHEIRRLERELEDLKEKRNIFENNIFKQTQKLEEMKSQMNWDQQALEAWLEESARKDEDSMILQKYTRQDDAKIKELSLRIEHLTDEAKKKRHRLDNEMTDTLTSQIELDKTAEEFRQAHAERQNLIAQWENTIDQMQKRDKEMDMLASQLARVKKEVKQREDTIAEKQQFLDSELENNKEQEKKISLAERSAAKQRMDYQEEEAQRDQFQSELDALKRTVDRTAMDLETTRSAVTQLKKDVLDKQHKLEQARAIHEVLVDKLQTATAAELSAEERAARMDEILLDEEKRQKEMDQELKRLRDLQFRKTQELHDSKIQERNADAEIQGSRAASKNLESKIGKFDHDSLKQQEIVYNQDFAIQQLERRINRMQGEQSNEEKIALEAKINQLVQELDEKTTTHNMLNIQIKRLQDDVRRVKRELESSSAERADLQSKIEELELHNDSSARELKKIVANKQDLMVEENILKLEMKRLRETLHNKADEVLSLEKRKLQLQTAMKERTHEVLVHVEMLTAQLRAADQERQQISTELHERISKIDKLKKRYEILMVSMAPPEGEEERSQAYYVIKAAQEKEEMQREGDELDAKIRKAEKEIRALENTLRLLNGRNEQYRKSFNKVTDISEEMDDKQQLEEQMRAVMDKYKYKRRQIRELQEDLQTMGHTLDNLARDEDAFNELIEERQNKIVQLNKELEDQAAKLERVMKQNAKAAREVRATAKSKGETSDERDMDVRELRELNKNATRVFGEVVHQYPDVAQAVSLYFTQSNLPPPPTPGSAASSRYSSRPSSARSSGSSAARRANLPPPPTPGSAASSRYSSRPSSARSSGSSAARSVASSRGSPAGTPSGAKPSSITIGADFGVVGTGAASPDSSRSSSSISSVRGGAGRR